MQIQGYPDNVTLLGNTSVRRFSAISMWHYPVLSVTAQENKGAWAAWSGWQRIGLLWHIGAKSRPLLTERETIMTFGAPEKEKERGERWKGLHSCCKKVDGRMPGIWTQQSLIYLKSVEQHVPQRCLKDFRVAHEVINSHMNSQTN